MRTLLLCMMLLFCFSVTAQKKAKIKGNKNVITEERDFEYFSKIEVNDKIKLNLKQSESSKLVIDADENLHDVIDSDLEGGTLVLSLNKRITSSKRFDVTLYIDDLAMIELNDDSKIKSIDKFNFFDMSVILNDKSDIKIDLESQIFSLESNEKSRGNFTVKADSVIVTMKESSKIKYTVNTTKLVANYNGSATGEFLGKTTNLLLNANDNASFKGSGLIAQETVLIAANGSNSYVNSKNNLEISAENKAKVYIFNSPTIIIKSLQDSASIFKRESMKLLEKL